MKPVYDKDGIVIYHGDMHDFVDLRADVVVTDAPYNARKNFGATTNDHQEWPEWCRWMDDVLDVCFRIAPDVLSFLSITAAKNYVRYGKHDPLWSLIWYKRFSKAVTAYPFLPHWEPILWWGSMRKAPGKGWGSDVLEANVEFGKTRFGHPTPKPLKLMRQLVARFPEDFVICDPFAGSLTTAYACHLEGRRCVAIEINGQFIQDGLKRWDWAVVGDRQETLL